MTIDRETAIRLAREAGVLVTQRGSKVNLWFPGTGMEWIERLCNLAAAHQAKQDEELMRKVLNLFGKQQDEASNNYWGLGKEIENRLEGV
jgi:hypothetical protein